MGQLIEKMLLFEPNKKNENWRECFRDGFLIKLLLLTTVARKKPNFVCTQKEGRAQELDCEVLTCCSLIER